MGEGAPGGLVARAQIATPGRLGAWGTFELRNGKRVDTTLESIADRKTEIAELDAAITQDEADGT